MTRGRFAGDDGSVLLLTIVYAALALALVLVVTAATSLYLERTRLYSLADGAALAGAEGFALDTARPLEGGRIATGLGDAGVRAAVNAYLAASPAAAQFDELAVDEAMSADGRTATVELSATWHPPVVAFVLPDGVRVEVEAVGRSVFG